MQTQQRRLPQRVQSRAMHRYRAPHQPPACDLWVRIRDAYRAFNAGDLDLAAFHAAVRQCLLRSAELTVAREISLPDAERINHFGAAALRQAQRRGTAAPDLAAVDSPAAAAAPARASGALMLE